MDEHMVPDDRAFEDEDEHDGRSKVVEELLTEIIVRSIASTVGEICGAEKDIFRISAEASHRGRRLKGEGPLGER